MMVVWSIKIKKTQIWITAAAVVLMLAAIVFGIVQGGRALTTAGKAGLLAETEDQRKAFLRSCGWEVSEDPVEIRQVTIPDTFNQVYTDYNAMQQKQGFDLERYRGKTVKRWTYEVKNYPEAGDNQVYVDLLVYNGRVIGGSVGTRTADGFMQGLKAEDTTKK